MRYVCSAVGIAAALLMSISRPVFGQGNTLSIVPSGYMEVNEVRVDRTHWYVTSTAVLQNIGSQLNGVTATISSLVSTIQVVAGQGTLHFSPVPAGMAASPSQVTSSNSFTLLVDRSVTFDWSQVQWSFNAPFANAGPNQTVTAGSTVTLNGSGSTNSGSIAPLTYSWAFVPPLPAGSKAALANANTMIASFVADVMGTYNVQLTVSNGSASDSAVVTVGTQAAPPVANAGPNQTIAVASVVNLDGTKSTDSDGAPLTYTWSFVSLPTNSTAQISSPRSPTPSFVADKSGTYIVQLVVNDGNSNSQPSTVTITTGNTPPVASATCSVCSGSNGTAALNSLIQLDGSKSTDADGDTLTYQWSLNTSQAPGSKAVLSATNIVNPTFTVDVQGTYVAQLTVSDGVYQNQATVTITTSAILAPTAYAGPNQTIQAGSNVQLGGSGSDPQNLPLTYSWSLITLPTGSHATLSATNIANPKFTTDAVGTYVAQLIVNDGILSSSASTVTITSNDTAPVAVPMVTNQGTIFMQNTVYLDGSKSTAATGQSIVSYSWSLVGLPPGSRATLTGGNTATPTFVADVAGTYVAQLIVKDAFLSSSPATATISVASMGIGMALSPLSPLYSSSQTSTLTVTLSPPAGGTPVTVNFTGYDPTVISLPPNVVVLANSNQATVTVTPLSAGPTGTATTEIYATATGYTEGTLNVTVDTPSISITFMNNATGVGLQNTVNGTITLAAPAPSPNGTTVTLTATPEANNGGNVSFNSGTTGQSATVTIQPGNTTGSFTITGQALGTVDLAATASGYTRGTFTGFLVVSLGAVVLPTNLKVGYGQSTSLNVQLSSPGGAPVGGTTVTLSSSNPSVLTISPTTVTIPQGQNAPNPLPQVTGVATGQVSITASAPGFTGDTETAQVIASVNFSPQTLSVGAGGVQPFSILLSAPAPTGGLQVNLTSSNTAAATVTQSVLINGGQVSGTAQVSGVAAGQTTITGSTCTTCAGNQYFDASGASVTVTVTRPAAPSITSLSPTSGAVGTAVTIAGANFGSTQGTSTVTFNSTSAGTATSWSATSITINVPTGATTGNVIVTVGGTASNGIAFTVVPPPSITSLSPTSGAVGTAVTIAGTNFGSSQGTSTVTFNGTGAGAATSWSATSVTINVPSGATTGNVVVTVSGVASNGVSFTVLSTPNISGLSPTSGAVGTTVTITGTNFGATQGTSTVTFSGTSAGTATSWSATSITIKVPTGATTGNVIVTVNGVASNGVSFTVVPPPSITSLSPTSGAVGSAVTITGTNFGATQGTSTVTFNGTSAGTATSWSATSITINVPSGATTGNVVVTVSGVASNGVSFTVAPAPSITSLSPTSGAVGTAVTITGANFGSTQGTSTVTFNGTNAGTATSWSATSITINVPTGATTGNVVVTVSGVASNGVTFTVVPPPSITSLSPTSGAVGSAVTITGTNFGSTQGTSSVTFNGTSAGTATSWSATSITIKVPTGATTGNVIVTVNGVASNGVSFTVVPPPGITSLSPTSGAVGSAVTITGTNFGATQGTSAVTFNGTTAGTATSWSATSITINVPNGATTGNVVVTVSGVASNGVSFTVAPAPSITSLSPTSGAVGTAVTITGANFGATQGTSTVTFNGTNAGTATSWSASSITINVPTGATTGNVVVTVSSVASNAVTFTVVPPPSITSLSPTSGAVGTAVTITGTNFGSTQGTSTVTFNGTNAGTATSWGAASITINVPSGATTGNVVVTVSGVASNGVSFTVLPTPNISGLSPTSGAVGTAVTITGTNFGSTQGSSTVTFNGTGAGTATSWSATSITINVPSGATTGNVVVTVSGVASNGVGFTVLSTPNISGLSPTSGAVGTAVTITGTNFGSTQGTSTVTFNGTGAGTATSWSATSITINVPSGATTGNVVVTVSGVASNGVSFTVLPTPNISGLSPTSGAVGTAVTVTGTNFGATQGTSTVTFNGTGAGTATSWSATSITINVPSGATTGNVVVTVSGVASNGVSFTVLPTPNISGLSPTSGAVGTAVTITGTNFGSTQGTSTVTFNGTSAGTATSWSATSITINVPTGATSGNVVVKVSGVASNGVAFTVIPPPNITSLTPNSGPVGTQVTIAGTNFGATQGSSTVTFNGTSAGTATSWSATSITINVPSGATTGNVVVTVSGVASNGVSFTVLSTPNISGLSPTSGSVGTAVTITGTNFGATQGTSTVTFNGTGAGTATSWSATSITINVPSGATSGNVVVTVNAVASNGVAFTVNTPPAITSVTPNSGPVGTQVTIAGTNFGASQGTSSVTFNGTSAGTATSWSATSITINVPTGATTGAVVVTVGGAASNSSISFTVTTAPHITSLSPTSGPVGTQVTITGVNFGATQGTSTVTFNGTAARTVTAWSATSIVAAVPSGATSGNVVVTVGGTASNGVSFTINVATLTLSPSTLPNGTVNLTYSAQVSASGGTLPYNWSSTGLPSWLTFDTTSNGSLCGTTLTLCGTPTATGTYTFTITVTDGGTPAQMASVTYSLTIAAATGNAVLTITEGSGTSSNFSVGYGLEVPVTITFSPAPTVAVNLTISSNNPAVVIGNSATAGSISIGPISVGAGTSSVTTYVQAVATSAQPVTITASATSAGYTSGTASVTVGKSGFVLSGPNGGIGGSFNAYQSTISSLSVLAALIDSTGNYIETENVAGGLSFSVPLGVTPSSLGTLSTTSAAFTGGNGTVPVNFTASGSNTGSASISITQQPAGFANPTATSTTLTANVQQSGVVPPSVTVGQNLQTSANVALSGGATAGSPIGVTLTSSDPTKLLFAVHTTDAGSASITVTIPTGQSHTPDFYVFGYANTGSVQYTISATGNLGTITTQMPMGPSGLQLQTPGGYGQNFSVTLGNPNATLNIYTALVDGSGNVLAYQAPAGNVNVSATVTSSNTAAGTITASPVTIAAGTSYGTTYFQPAAQGTSTITASATGFASSSVTATVSTPTLTVNNQLTVGQHLAQQGMVILSAHAPGLQITLTSNDPSQLKLAVNPTDPGSSSITLTVDQNGDNPTFWVYGEASSGSPTYTASATNWKPGTDTVALAPSGVLLAGGIWPNALCYGTFSCAVSLASGAYTFSVVAAQLTNDGTNTFVAAQPLAGDAGSVTVPLHYSNGQVATVPASAILSPGSQQALVTLTPTGTGSATISTTEPTGWAIPVAGGANLNQLSINVQ